MGPSDSRVGVTYITTPLTSTNAGCEKGGGAAAGWKLQGKNKEDDDAEVAELCS